MREILKVNAMRSGVVVVGALAFGYLTLQLGFRPYLERAQETLDNRHPSDESLDNAQRISEYSHIQVKDNQYILPSAISLLRGF
ncbi:hypothetical protein RHMOL_Rhmol03G0190200 [Rhododendron molle]|uniref:Uncharacterized protein n=1 Tax=Rhododendron molle TaxID=49168 RepID=A0ACC0PIB8_RHOML|nr:hypothetical protein RHMOL_Rhmol03G0190200 [Rhododendron molle]